MVAEPFLVSVVIPAKAGIQEGGDTVVKGCRFYRMARWLSFLLSFPLCGNGLNKPLDSGLRRNDEELASGFSGITEGWDSGFCRNDEGLDSRLRRNDEMLVVTAVVISACPRQVSIMKKKEPGM